MRGQGLGPEGGKQLRVILALDMPLSHLPSPLPLGLTSLPS